MHSCVPHPISHTEWEHTHTRQYHSHVQEQTANKSWHLANLLNNLWFLIPRFIYTVCCIVENVLFCASMCTGNIKINWQPSVAGQSICFFGGVPHLCSVVLFCICTTSTATWQMTSEAVYIEKCRDFSNQWWGGPTKCIFTLLGVWGLGRTLIILHCHCWTVKRVSKVGCTPRSLYLKAQTERSIPFYTIWCNKYISCYRKCSWFRLI